MIVHHRDFALLDRCLSTLVASCGVYLEVVVVANACQEEIPTRDPSALTIHVVATERPLGFSAANNFAVDWAKRSLSPADYYFFLNNDTEVAPDALAILVDDLEQSPGWAVAGPCLRILGAEDHLNSLGINVSRVGEAWDEGIGRSISEYGPLPGQREVLAVTGSALLIRSHVFDEIQGWTELYGYYLEDVDLCLKVRSHGWAVVNDAAACVHHALSATASSEFKTLLSWRNQILLMVTRWPWWLLARALPLHAARSLAIYWRRRRIGAVDDAALQARAWSEAIRLLPSALGTRRRTSGGDTRWVGFLRPAGSVPVIRLPERKARRSATAGTESSSP